MSEWRDNPGKCPEEAFGKRVVVELRDGTIAGELPVSPVTPAGWPASGKFGCRWSLTNYKFDIVRYRVL